MGAINVPTPRCSAIKKDYLLCWHGCGIRGVMNDMTYPDKQETRSWLCFGNGGHIHPVSYRIFRSRSFLPTNAVHLRAKKRGTKNIDRKNMDKGGKPSLNLCICIWKMRWEIVTFSPSQGQCCTRTACTLIITYLVLESIFPLLADFTYYITL